jgi:hypothetical protein
VASGAIRITRLNPKDVKRMANAVRGSVDPAAENVVVSGPVGDVDRIVKVARSLADREARDEGLVDLLLQDVEPRLMGSAHLEQLRLQAQAKAAFLTEVPLLTSREVGESLGSTAQNTSAMASRLKGEGRLFAVPHKGVDLYPAFQIVDGEVQPAVARVIKAFAGDSPWAVALWFQAGSGWLGGDRPMDRLADDPDAVVDAAQKTTEPLAT